MSLQHSVKQHLLIEYGLSADDVEELFESAKSSVQEGLDHLKAHIQNKSFDEIASVSHTLKGNFLNMGLDEPATLVQHLEAMAKERSYQELNADFDMLVEKIAPLF